MQDDLIVEVLAKRMGWTRCFTTDGGYQQGISPEGLDTELPNFTNSLDALRPVLEGMSDEEWTRFQFHAFSLFKSGVTMAEAFLTMTPLQIATCAVKAMGLYVDTASTAKTLPGTA